MSNKKHYIKMHVCESVFRRRNFFLHEADKADKTKLFEGTKISFENRDLFERVKT